MSIKSGHGQSLAKIRKELANMTRMEFATAIGISNSYVCKLENNQIPISDRILKEVSAVAGVPVPLLEKSYFSARNTTNEDKLKTRISLRQRIKEFFTVVPSGLSTRMFMSVHKTGDRTEVCFLHKDLQVHAYVASNKPKLWPDHDLEQNSNKYVFIGLEESLKPVIQDIAFRSKGRVDVWTNDPGLAKRFLPSSAYVFDIHTLFQVVGLPVNTDIIMHAADPRTGTREGEVVDLAHAIRISYLKMINA